jgi:hypothetical protein
MALGRTRQPLKNLRRGGSPELERITIDTSIGMVFSNAIAFFIVLTTAATLNTHGVTDIQTAADAANALRPIAGDFAFALFALGIIGTGLLAIPVLAGSAAYAVADVFGWRSTLEAKFPEATGFRDHSYSNRRRVCPGLHFVGSHQDVGMERGPEWHRFSTSDGDDDGPHHQPFSYGPLSCPPLACLGGLGGDGFDGLRRHRLDAIVPYGKVIHSALAPHA